MDFPLSVHQIEEARNILIEILDGILGWYFINKAKKPACSIMYTIDKYPSHDVRTEGLEALISPPDANGIPYYSAVAADIEWRIKLIQHDRKSNTLAGQFAILKKFPQTIVESRLSQTEHRHEQLNLLIKNTEVI